MRRLSSLLACAPLAAALATPARASPPAIPGAPLDRNIVKTLAPQAKTYDAFGDSITAGYAATASANNYVSRLAASLGVTATNHGVSGSEAGDQQAAIYAFSPNDTASQLISYMIGTNDGTFWGSGSTNVQTWHPVYQSELAWLALPARAKHLGQDTTDIAYSGSGGSHWSPSSAFGGAMSEQTQTSGDTATFQIWGRCVYVAYGIDSVTTGGQFTITVDGTNEGTFYSQGAGQTGAIPARLGATHASSLARICGLPLAFHSVVVTVTSATSPSNVVWLDWVGQPDGSQFANGPVVLAGSPPSNLNTTGQQSYTAYIQQDVSLLTGDGLNIAYVETAGYLAAPSDFEWSSYQGYIIGNTLTVTGLNYTPNGAPNGNIAVGLKILGPSSVAASTTISALGSGTGGVGTYTVNNSQTVGSAGSPVALYLGDGTHPSDAGHLHIAQAFEAVLNSQASGKIKTAASGQASPLLQAIWGCGSYFINTPVQGNAILGGGYASTSACNPNYMSGSGLNNAIVGGRLNVIGGGGIVNTNNNFIGGGVGDVVQFGANNCALGGTNNVAQGFNNCTVGGRSNQTKGDSSIGLAGRYGTDRGRINTWYMGNGALSTLGAMQEAGSVFGGTGASTAPICATSDGAAAAASNKLNLPINSAATVTVRALVRGQSLGTTYAAYWDKPHVLSVGASLAATTLDGGTSQIAPDETFPASLTSAGVSFYLQAETGASTGGSVLVCFVPPNPNSDTWHFVSAHLQVEAQ